MKNGIFITFEGNDGSGKSTQIARLDNYLINMGLEVVLLREPGGTAISESIREVLLDNKNTEMSYNAEALLYAAARAQLVDQIIKPSVSQRKVVICDRFVDSSYAYQGFGRGIPMETVRAANEVALSGFMPDLTIFLDIDPVISLSRRMKASAVDRLEAEKMEFHQRVYQGYKCLLEEEPHRIKAVNANQEKELVWSEIKAHVDNLIDELYKMK